ncbi:MAG: flagellar basal body P-ring formation chaperone FlgA [Holophaga sp.]|nr:flagellar basal body P-ring formation chaperone FlgA [Holophaga sp.]
MRALLMLLLSGFLVFAGEQVPSTALAERLQEEAIAFALEKSKASGGHYVIRATRSPTLPRVHGSQVTFEPSHLSKREPTGHFFAVFRVLMDGRLAGNARVDLEGRWTGNLLRTKTSLSRKTVPAEDQLEESPFEGNPPPGAISALPVGYRLRANVQAGHVLTQSDLEPIPLVSTGERVRISVQFEALIISADATARSSGALGDKIRVELPNRKWVQAIVTGCGEAKANWGS